MNPPEPPAPPPPPPRRPAPRLSRGRRLLFALVVAAATVVGLDLAGSALDPRVPVPAKLRRSPHDPGSYFLPDGPHTRVLPALDELPRDREPSRLRIFTYGGSSTAGTPFDHHASFSGWLKLLLDDALGPGRVEVANLGYRGQSLPDVLDSFEDSLPYSPDVAIVYAGHNELLLANLTAYDRATTPLWLWETRHWGERHSFWVRTVRRWTAPPLAGPRAFEPTAVDAGRFLSEVEPEFERRLERIVELARERGVRLVLSTVVANVRDWQPVDPRPIDDATREAVATFRSSYEAADATGRERLLAGALASRDLRFTFHVARALLDVGDVERGGALLRIVRDRDSWAMRAPSYLTDAVRRVAGRHPEVALFDAERDLSEASPDGLVGDEWLLDYCHPKPAGHFRIARGLYETLRTSGMLADLGALPASGPLPPVDALGGFEAHRARAPGFDPEGYRRNAEFHFGVGRFEVARDSLLLYREQSGDPLRAAAWLAVAETALGRSAEGDAWAARALAAARAAGAADARAAVLAEIGERWSAEREALGRMLDQVEGGPDAAAPASMRPSQS